MAKRGREFDSPHLHRKEKGASRRFFLWRWSTVSSHCAWGLEAAQYMNFSFLEKFIRAAVQKSWYLLEHSEQKYLELRGQLPPSPRV